MGIRRETSVDPTVDAPIATTGEPSVDAALRRLAVVDEAPLHEHPALLGSVHQDLDAVLRAAPDAGPE